MKKASPKPKQVPVRAIDELILYWPEHLIAHALLGSILNSHIFKIFEFQRFGTTYIIVVPNTSNCQFFEKFNKKFYGRFSRS